MSTIILGWGDLGRKSWKKGGGIVKLHTNFHTFIYLFFSWNYTQNLIFQIFQAVATGLFYGEHAYFKSGWNIMDGTLVIVSLFDTTISVIFGHTSKIFDILRVFRLVRALRPLRVINRAPGLKLVVQTLLSSLKPIGNIVLICCTFFIIFGILGVQVPALFFHYLY